MYLKTKKMYVVIYVHIMRVGVGVCVWRGCGGHREVGGGGGGQTDRQI